MCDIYPCKGHTTPATGKPDKRDTKVITILVSIAVALVCLGLIAFFVHSTNASDEANRAKRNQTIIDNVHKAYDPTRVTNVRVDDSAYGPTLIFWSVTDAQGKQLSCKGTHENVVDPVLNGGQKLTFIYQTKDCAIATKAAEI
jgi:hypothetical protein